MKAESVWQFAWRRMRRIGVELYGRGASTWDTRARMPNLLRLRAAMLVAALTWVCFAAIAGWSGALLLTAPENPLSAGRRLACFGLHAIRATTAK